MTTHTRTPESLRELARQKENEAHESFQRCDTDGALSQWASEINARRLYVEADILENDGLAEFPALFTLDGELVTAIVIDGRFGACWMLLDDAGESLGEFVPFSPARRSTLEKRGYTEGLVLRPARAKVSAHSGGMATAYVDIVATDAPTDAPAKIITTDVWEVNE
jgi:hypothetical protein